MYQVISALTKRR